MSSQTIGLLIGGILPAFLFAFGNTLIKSSSDSGIGVLMLLLFEAVGYVIFIGVMMVFAPTTAVNFKSATHATFAGITLAAGTFFVTLALQKYAMPNSQLVPLYNMNTLIAVVLALWLFSEWKDVKAMQLIVGALFIVIGGTLVARA